MDDTLNAVQVTTSGSGADLEGKIRDFFQRIRTEAELGRGQSAQDGPNDIANGFRPSKTYLKRLRRSRVRSRRTCKTSADEKTVRREERVVQTCPLALESSSSTVSDNGDSEDSNSFLPSSEVSSGRPGAAGVTENAQEKFKFEVLRYLAVFRLVLRTGKDVRAALDDLKQGLGQILRGDDIKDEFMDTLRKWSKGIDAKTSKILLDFIREADFHLDPQDIASAEGIWSDLNRKWSLVILPHVMERSLVLEQGQGDCPYIQNDRVPGKWELKSLEELFYELKSANQDHLDVLDQCESIPVSPDPSCRKTAVTSTSRATIINSGRKKLLKIAPEFKLAKYDEQVKRKLKLLRLREKDELIDVQRRRLRAENTRELMVACNPGLIHIEDDPTKVRWTFPKNLGIKEIDRSTGVVKYLFKEAGVLETIWPRRARILEFINGQVERINPDKGRTELVFSSGNGVRITYPGCHQTETSYSDGTIWTDARSEGVITIEMKDGYKEIREKMVTTSIYPGGARRRVYRDGSEELRFPNGRIIFRGPRGGTIFDGIVK